METFAGLGSRPDELLLFLNLDLAAGTDDHEELPSALAALVRGSNLLPRNVAVEFLEARLEDVGRFGALADALREHGFLVVLDDVGAGHSNLDRIPLFRPDVIKVDRSLISGVRDDFYKQETLKSLVNLSRRVGALVVAEGIETDAEAIVALELGVDLLQGFFLSRPVPASAFDGGVRVARGIEQLAHRFKSHMVGEINERKRQHRRFNVIQNGILCDLTNAKAAEFDEILLHLIDDFPKVECVYVLDDAGIQVTETICNAAVTQRPGAAMFKPAPQGHRPLAQGVLLRAHRRGAAEVHDRSLRVAGERKSLPHHQHLLPRRREQPSLRALRRRQPVAPRDCAPDHRAHANT